MTKYSFVGVTGVFIHPDAGTFVLSGELGVVKITIEMLTTNTIQNISADGNVMQTYRPGRNGQITIEVQQTCDMHDYLVAWSNLIITAASLGNIDNYFAAEFDVRSTSDGSMHRCIGISPEKIPNKEYGAEAATISWVLLAGDVVSTPGSL